MPEYNYTYKCSQKDERKYNNKGNLHVMAPFLYVYLSSIDRILYAITTANMYITKQMVMIIIPTRLWYIGVKKPGCVKLT